MELKKSKEASAERLRLPMVLVGTLFTGSLVLASFTYQTPEELKDQLASEDRAQELNFEQNEEEPEQKVEEIKAQTVAVTPPPQEEIKVEINKPEPPKTTSPPDPPAPPAPKTQPKVEVEIVEFPDVEASFPGGAAEMKKWITDNVQYPEMAKELGDQGRVFVSFVVGADGDISDIKVTRGVSEDLDDEAKRLVRNMPKWKPGEVKGEKVVTRCRLPITFTLQ